MPAPALYLDEDVLPSVAGLLRSEGYDAVSAHELGRKGLSDPAHLAYAAGGGRVLVSYDVQHYKWLAEEWFLAGREHAGILLGFHQYSADQTGGLLAALVKTLETVRADEMANSVRYIEEFARDAG